MHCVKRSSHQTGKIYKLLNKKSFNTIQKLIIIKTKLID